MDVASATTLPAVDRGRASGDAPAVRHIVRGGAILFVAKLTHVAAGFGLYFFLAMFFTRSLGNVAGAAAFGIWGAVMSLINPINMMFVIGTQQAVSHFAASRAGSPVGAFWTCAWAQIVIVAGLFAGFQILAPQIAGWRLNDAAYVPYLRLASLIFVFYAAKSLYQGYLNGVQRFAAQSWLDIGSSVARMVLVLSAAAIGWGVTGALGGFVASAALLAVVAAVVVRPARDAGPALRRVFAFQGKVMVMAFLANFLMSVDIQAVAAWSAQVPEVAQRYAGYYTAGQKLAQIPYSLIIALSTLIFPLIAREASNPDRSVPAGIVRQGMRALLFLLVPCVAILAATPGASMTLVFPSLARAASEAGDPASVFGAPLAYLALAYGFFSIFMMGISIITAGGRPGIALLIVAATLVLSDGLVIHLTRSMGPVGAAVGVALAWALGVAMIAIVLLRRYGTMVSPLSAARILACGGAVYFVASAVPATGMRLLILDAGLGALFIVLLLLTFELRLAEIARVLGELPSPWSRRAGGSRENGARRT